MNKQNITIRFMYPDVPMANCPKRMQYFVTHPEDAEKFSLGTSGRYDFKLENLKKWVENREVLELKEPVALTGQQDLYLDNNNQLFAGAGWDPKEPEHIVMFGELNKLLLAGS